MTAPVAPKFNGEVFRKDHPMVISTNRQLASLLGVILAYNSNGYKAGTVLAKNTVSGEYAAYNDAGASGLGTAAAILFDDVAATDFPSTAQGVSVVAIFGGEVYKDQLTGLDANAITDLKAREISTPNATILKF